MKKGLLAALLSTAIVLVACGAVEEKPIEKPAETTAEITTAEASSVITPTEPAEAIDAGVEAINVMFDYMASGDKDGTVEKLQNLQGEINDDTNSVSGFISLFIVDVLTGTDNDGIIEEIHLLEDYLAEHSPY